MPRHWLRRALGACLAVWFGVSLTVVEAPALHQCPVHDGVAALPMAMPHHHGGAPHGSPHGSGHQGCTCLGDCSTTAVVVVRPAPVVAAAIVDAPPPPPFAERAAPRPATPHRLPFANGPPPAHRA